MTPSSFTPYNSAHTYAKILKVLLILGAVINLLEIVGILSSLLVPPMPVDAELAHPGTIAVTLLRVALLLLSGVLYIITVVLFLMWMYRSFKNVSTFGSAGRLTFTPGWAVGMFFIPFVNLVFPYRAVRELWQNSAAPEEHMFAAPSPPAFFIAWWVCWILCCIVGNIAFRLTTRRDGPDTPVLIVGIIAESLTIMAGLLAFLVVSEIDERQENTAAELKLASFTAPPAPPIYFEPPANSPQY